MVCVKHQKSFFISFFFCSELIDFFSECGTNKLRYGKIWILVTQPFLPVKESAHCVSTSFHYAKLLIKTGSRMSHNNGWWRRLLHIKESCKEVITKTIAELSPWASNHFSHETWNSSDDLKEGSRHDKKTHQRFDECDQPWVFKPYAALSHWTNFPIGF